MTDYFKSSGYIEAMGRLQKEIDKKTQERILSEIESLEQRESKWKELDRLYRTAISNHWEYPDTKYFSTQNSELDEQIYSLRKELGINE